jgi:hypothetical protein
VKGKNPTRKKQGGSNMDYSFENVQVETEKNFTRNKQVKETAKAIAEKLRSREEKKNA